MRGFDPYFPQFQDYSRFSHSPVPGLSTGQPLFDAAAMALLGQHIAPRPLPGTTQSIYDAYRMRDRNLDFIMARNTAFSNSLMAQRFGGVNMQSPLFQAISPMIADPDGLAMRFLSPLQGGNPVKAQMGLFANLTGHTSAALGMTGNVNVAQTTQMMNDLYRQVYQEKTIGYGSGPGMFSLDEFRNNSIRRVNTMLGTDDPMARDFVNAFSTGGRRAFQMKYGTEFNSNFNSLIDKVDAARGTGNFDTVRNEAHKAANEFFKKINDPEVKNTMQQAFKEAIEKGGDAATRFKDRFRSENKDIISMLRTFEGFESRIGEKVPVGINFNRTRGFQLEDIAGGFTNAADSFLIRKGRGIGDFAQHGLGVLDAARGLFGNDKTGSELSRDLSRLLGSSFVDLGDAGDSRKVEDLLRQVKAAARTAGVTVESILGIIEEGKMLTNGRLGGIPLMGMAVRTMDQTTMLTQLMGNDKVRMLGGPVGIAQRVMAGEAQATTEPITQRAAALYGMFSQQGNTKATQMIESYLSDPNSDATRTGFNAFVNRLAKATGNDVFSLQQFASTSPAVSELGLRRNPALSDLAGKSAVNTFERMVRAQLGGAAQPILEMAFGGKNVDVNAFIASNKNLTADQIKALQTVAGRPDKGQLTMAEFAALTGLQDPQGFTQYMEQNGYDVGLRTKYDPKARALAQQQKAFREESAKIDADMSAKMGRLNAPIVQTMLNQALNGSLGSEGISAVMDVLKDNSPEYQLMRKEITALQELGDGSRKDVKGALTKYYSSVLGLGTGDVNEMFHVTGKLSRDDMSRVSRMKADEAKRFLTGTGLTQDQVKSANTTLSQIDEKGRLTGNISEADLLKFTRERGVERFVEAQFSTSIKEQNELADKRFQDMLAGKMVGGIGGQDIAVATGVISNRLGKFGVFNNGKLNADRFSRLLHGSGDESLAFNAELLSIEKDGGHLSQAMKAIRDNIIGDRDTAINQYKTPVEAIVKGKEQEKKTTEVLEGIEKLISVLGANFSPELIKEIGKLTSSINSLATNN